ncbi:MAG: hypothetical protein NXI20_00670 [bacterium]|nr:hypothetical protein [bacterium]
MEKPIFKERLVNSTKFLLEFTQSLVVNSLSENVKYLIEPNVRDTSDHLNKKEQEKLKELSELGKTLLNVDQITEVLFVNGLVPLWINIEVYNAKKGRTIIKLNCSRRLRSDSDLNHIAEEHPPFHPLVPLPPWHKKGEKFNINWKQQSFKRKWYYWKWKLGFFTPH